MTYRLAENSGDCLRVPQLVFGALPHAEGEYVRVALYIIATHSTDAGQIAKELCLKNVKLAQKALDYWYGAGLLCREKPQTAALQPEKPAPLTADELRIAALQDPALKVLMGEMQRLFGKTLGHKEMGRLAALYVQESIPTEVILLCANHLKGLGKPSIAFLERELTNWAAHGVATGQDAEKHLQLLQKRQQNEAAVAALLGIQVADLTVANRNCICRWFEEYGYTTAMIEQAILHAGDKKEIVYLNGILKNWHAKGWHCLEDVRGAGQLTATNVRVDRAAHSGNDILAAAKRRPLRLKREE